MHAMSPQLQEWKPQPSHDPAAESLDHAYWSSAYPAQHLALVLAGVDVLEVVAAWEVTADDSGHAGAYAVTLLRDGRGQLHVAARPLYTATTDPISTAPFLGPVVREGDLNMLPVYRVTNNPRASGSPRAVLGHLSDVARPRSINDGLPTAYAAIDAIYAADPTPFLSPRTP